MSLPKPDLLPGGLPPLLGPEQGLAREQQLLEAVGTTSARRLRQSRKP
ncbi:hypothetical protein [Zobellella denitrificans]|nr:hypothetical protein [Zobellella denitrificans]